MYSNNADIALTFLELFFRQLFLPSVVLSLKVFSLNKFHPLRIDVNFGKRRKLVGAMSNE